jgi:recombination protein RecR
VAASSSLKNLTRTISKLPGLGPRIAQKIVLHILKDEKFLLDKLMEEMISVRETVQKCRICGNLDDANPCNLCEKANNETSQLCIVESVADLWAVERAGFFKGKYHVLDGTLSVIDGIGPEQLSVKQLLSRLETEKPEEVVIALNATLEGQSTTFYLTELLADFNVKVSSFAQGVPIGGELHYLDDITLATAFADRRVISTAEKFALRDSNKEQNVA